MTLGILTARARVGVVLSACLLAGAIEAQAQTTILDLDSEPGDYIGQGLHRTFTPADGAFSLSRNFDNGVSVSFYGTDPGVWWFLDFAAPADVPLAPGIYAGAMRYPFQDPTAPGLSVSGEGRGCNTLTGDFSILYVHYDAAGEVTGLAATFEQHCEGASPALFGTIQVNAPLQAPPAEPVALTAVVVNGNAQFTWQRPPTGWIAHRYRLEAGVGPGTTLAAFETTGEMPALQLSGVPAGRFFVRVRGINESGLGLASDEIELLIGPGGTSPPGPPLDVAATVTGSTLSMTWSLPSPVGALDGYVLEAGSAPGASDVAVLPLGATPLFTYDGVPPGFYFLRVRARNQAGVGPASSELMIVVGGVPAPPGAPQSLGATVTGSLVRLAWTAPASGTPTLYRIEAGSRPGLSDLAVALTSAASVEATFALVPPGRYYVRVRAVNGAGSGLASNEVRVVVAAP
ncbi:MAG: fibronectin type III domain-containing protein [Vicinamibacterales bacterium]